LTLSLVATAAFGLESVVARELEALGYQSRALRPGWLAFEGDETAVARANLWLRASDRVLLSLAVFPAPDFDALFEGTRAVAWERFLPPAARVPVRGRSVKSLLSGVPACQSIVKKAIVERLKRAYGIERLPEDGHPFPVEVALLKDEAILALDTTGAGLHKRGYRLESGEAPLKETLAAGLVLLTHWNRDRPFLDPFCGTGTLAIEAALIGRNRAPGRGRSFASESWPWIPPAIWKRSREEARDLEKRALEAPLEASDLDESVLSLARRAAAKASVQEDIRFSRRDVSETASSREYGCLITNPPYGERIADRAEAREIHRALPGVFRKLPTWSFFILTAESDFEKIAGQSADRRRKLFNGDVECVYFQFLGPRPGREGKPAFGGVGERARRQAEIFANRLRKRAHHLRKWPKRGTDVYRIYDRDIKEVPLALDRYGDCLLLTPATDPLESRTRAEHEDWLDLMAATASETLGVPGENVFVLGRNRTPRLVRVQEEGHGYDVRLSGEGDRDFDPALRILRRWLREQASGKRVRILGPESLFAAARSGGALSVAREGRGPHDIAVVDLSRLEEDDVLPTLLARRMARASAVYLFSRDPRVKLDVAALSAFRIEDVSEQSLPEDFRSRKSLRLWRLVPTSTSRAPSPARSLPRDRSGPRTSGRRGSPPGRSGGR
jgi:23S rRNA G2445 N2-methylase RlmL